MRMENGRGLVWYRLRGLGLTCLCSLVFFIGAYLNNQKNEEVSTAVNGQRQPLYQVRTEERKVALTFDTTGGNRCIQEILDTLAGCGVKATFFVTGEWAGSYPEELKRITEGDHDIGCFGQKYVDMTEFTKQEIKETLQISAETVRELTGHEVRLFRAPYGKYSNEQIETAELLGYTVIGWSIDSEDWKNYGMDSVIGKVTQSEHLENGAVIRMHGDAEDTVQSLEAVISGLREMGYEPVSLTELAAF